MQSTADYLLRTESAVRLLFSGVDSYLNILKKATGVTFITSEPFCPKQDAEFAEWQLENSEQLAIAKAAEREFIAESFALDTLCGAILQVADKALELYGSNKSVPPHLSASLKPHHAKYCVGRSVRTIPLGLIVYAARNQHTHFNEDTLREPSASVFHLLATAYGYGGRQQIIDPAFDLANQRLVSFASNITSLIGWRTYEKYAADMRSMLGA